MKQKENNNCRLYIVRHGETEWNIKGFLQGHTDIPLNNNGIEQAKALCENLGDIKFDGIYSSDLSRARQTAEIIGLEKRLALQTSRLLRERSLGSWEGGSFKKYAEGVKQSLAKFGEASIEAQQKIKIYEDVENDHEIVSRFVTILREISVGNPNKNILIVSHGGIMRAFLVSLGYFPKGSGLSPGHFGNCGYMKIECDGADFEIKKVVGFKMAEIGGASRN